MDTWILRFPEPRQNMGDARQLIVLKRNADGEIVELETLEIEGRHANLPNVVEGQVKQGRKRIILDLFSEKRLDSNDLAQLIGAVKYAGDAGGEVVFANPQSRVREIFRLTHLEDVVSIFDSIGEAAEHFPASD